jgi:putative membrane protein|tara:strand:- start:71 stop:337 length:267 start_codon:yes stop_codon:yes gene_type:complete
MDINAAYAHHGHMSSSGLHGGCSIFACIVGVLVFVVIILLIIWLYKQIKPPQTMPHNIESLDILKKRFAKGEISKQEFEDMQDIIKKN